MKYILALVIVLTFYAVACPVYAQQHFTSEKSVNELVDILIHSLGECSTQGLYHLAASDEYIPDDLFDGLVHFDADSALINEYGVQLFHSDHLVSYNHQDTSTVSGKDIRVLFKKTKPRSDSYLWNFLGVEVVGNDAEIYMPPSVEDFRIITADTLIAFSPMAHEFYFSDFKRAVRDGHKPLMSHLKDIGFESLIDKEIRMRKTTFYILKGIVGYYETGKKVGYDFTFRFIDDFSKSNYGRNEVGWFIIDVNKEDQGTFINLITENGC